MSQTPAPSPEPAATRLARIGFRVTRRRDAAGVPRLPPEFVAEQGRVVRILDVREESELTGLLGHVPAATHVPMKDLSQVPAILAADTLVVLVSNTGHRAGVAANYLESLGMTHVAALEGGVAAWKKLGFGTSREPTWRRELKALPPGMGRDGRPLEHDADGRICAGQLARHAIDAGAVRWVRLSAFVNNGRRSCVDGRDDSGVIGTPGGDMGELVLALAAAEQLRPEPFTRDEIRRALIAHIDAFGRFYMHSDIKAMNRLIIDGYRKDPRITPFIEHVFQPEEWRVFHQKVPEGAREAVLEHLLDPNHMGCGHLKLAMTDARYGVREGLIRDLLRVFHETRWAGAPELEWVVLGGDHGEGAVVEVVVNRELHGFTRIPLVSPQVDGVQVFVAHPEVVAHLRGETAAFLVEIGLMPRELEDQLCERIQDLGGRQLGCTLGKLAAGLPVLRLTFDGPTPGVTEVGEVPHG